MGRRIDEATKIFKGGLSGLFGLKVYGDNLLTRRVSTEMAVVSMVLLIQLCVDLWAWGRAWSYALPNNVILPITLGLAFATAILLFDRSIIVADISGTKRRVFLPLVGRFLLLILISFITAIPVELSVFHSEITNSIANKEKVKVDTIRRKAIAEEEKNYSKQITQARTDLVAAQGGTSLHRTQLSAYRAQRANERTQLVAARQAEADRRQTAINAQLKSYNEEVEGQSATRRRGEGTAARGKKDVLDRLQADKKAFDSETSTILATFDVATEAEAKKKETTAATKAEVDEKDARSKLTKIEAEKDKAVATLRTMSNKDLGVKYGGEWQESYGFLARFNELRNMEADSIPVRMTVWGCRTVMIILGLLVLGMKLLSSQEFLHYYSLGVQAASGHSEALEVMGALGYETGGPYRSALGYVPRVKDLKRNLSHARRQLERRWNEFQQEVSRSAEPDDDTGMCLTLQEIHRQLHEVWRKSLVPAREALQRAEEECYLAGVHVPELPAELKPVVQDAEGWKVSSTRLYDLGWKDPQPLINKGRAALETIKRLRHEVEGFLAKMELELMDLLLHEPDLSLAELREGVPGRYRTFHDKIIPLLRQIEQAEGEAKLAKAVVPVWAALARFIEPAKIYDAWKLPDEMVLREVYGWKGRAEKEEEEPFVVPPAVGDTLIDIKIPEPAASKAGDASPLTSEEHKATIDSLLATEQGQDLPSPPKTGANEVEIWAELPPSDGSDPAPPIPSAGTGDAPAKSLLKVSDTPVKNGFFSEGDRISAEAADAEAASGGNGTDTNNGKS